MSPRVKQFIELQTQVDNQIAEYGEADFLYCLAEFLQGDSLTSNEINELIMHYEGDSED